MMSHCLWGQPVPRPPGHSQVARWSAQPLGNEESQAETFSWNTYSTPL
jgi:hypothetical protein